MGMYDMSRKSKAKYIKVRSQRYETASPARKSCIIDEVMDTTGFTRLVASRRHFGDILRIENSFPMQFPYEIR